MPVFNRNRHSGSSGVAAAYTIDNSCRFNDDDSANMSRSVTGSNRNLFTLSWWYKRSNLGTLAGFFNTFRTGTSAGFGIRFDTTNKLRMNNWNGSAETFDKITTQVFRDTSAWGHFVIAYDFANGTAEDRIKVYHNGVRITSFSTNTNPSAEDLGYWNTSNTHNIAREDGANEFDGYMAEVVHIDGAALAASSFGETDTNGNWVPIDPSSLTFGTNGFHLDFAVAPATGNGAGTDVSGEANHFTDSGLAAADQMNDSPSDSAADDVGNYCTGNPLAKNVLANCTMTDGNLVGTQTGSDQGMEGTQSFDIANDLVYWEVTQSAATPYNGIKPVGTIHNGNGPLSY